MFFDLRKQEVLKIMDSLGFKFEDMQIFSSYLIVECELENSTEVMKFLTSAEVRYQLAVEKRIGKSDDGELEESWIGFLTVCFNYKA